MKFACILLSNELGANRTLASTATGAFPYVEEALRWLPQENESTQMVISQEGREITFAPTYAHVPSSASSRILLVDVISDTGSGIRPDFLPYVFDRFTQSEVPSRHTPGGVGIGLARSPVTWLNYIAVRSR